MYQRTGAAASWQQTGLVGKIKNRVLVVGVIRKRALPNTMQMASARWGEKLISISFHHDGASALLPSALNNIMQISPIASSLFPVTEAAFPPPPRPQKTQLTLVFVSTSQWDTFKNRKSYDPRSPPFRSLSSWKTALREEITPSVMLLIFSFLGLNLKSWCFYTETFGCWCPCTRGWKYENLPIIPSGPSAKLSGSRGLVGFMPEHSNHN